MRVKIVLLIFACLAGSVFAQDKRMESILNKLNSNKIPYIYPKELVLGDNTILLDAREWDEYMVSKIPGAFHVGFNSFDIGKLKAIIPNKDNTIIVYCSIGVRSERVADQIEKAGYKNVFNLWGGIFEWKNEGKTVVDLNGNPTEKVHTFSKKWGVYLKKGTGVINK